MKNIFLFFILSSSLISCTKVIDINLNNAAPQLVIQGEITSKPGPYLVSLSKTVNFSNANIFPDVTGAFVTITDNIGAIDTLLETTSGKYQTQHILGIQGNTYTLKVIANGESYSASSTMPYLISIDSIGFLKSTFGGSGGPNAEPSYTMIPYFKDPIQTANYFKFIQYVNGEKDNSILVDNDNLINGLQYQRPIFSQGKDIKLNDTVRFELQHVDKATYDYFNTLNLSIGNGPGGGTAPANPVSNIMGKNVLGYFSAYSVDTKTVIVK